MTAKKVVVNVPSIAKGEKVEVLYLGVFENGGTHDITDEQVAQFEGSAQRQFPSSGYLFAGEPHGDVQQKAYDANEKEGIISTRPVELIPTEIDANISNVGIDPVEGTTSEEGDK